MKEKLSILFILFSFLFANAQKELWGVNSTQSYVDYSNPASPVTIPYFGNISKYDINGQNPAVVYEFDGVTGKLPKGKLFLASNGKLYGTTRNGGIIGPNGSGTENGLGVLYEYDLILNKYRVIHNFDFISGGEPFNGVIEPIIGKLYGTFGRKLFSFDLGLEQFSEFGNSNFFTINNELMKASNGFLYCTTMAIAGGCSGAQTNNPNYGSIIKINTLNNTYQRVYEFRCDATDGLNINTTTGTLIENQIGKLIGQVTSGLDFANTTNGLLYEFNINTNTFTKKIDFDGFNLGTSPNCLINNGNTKIYGVCQYGGSALVPPSTYSDQAGTLFEYTPSTNTIVKLYTFDDTTGFHPKSITKASTGDYFGIWGESFVGGFGIFKFNPTDNSVIMPTPPFTPTPLNAGATESLIEICRKPFYQEFIINTFTPCIGDIFNFNVQNTNATSYVWKKNNIVLPTQTTGTLSLASVTTSDSGTYICEMINECGTTVTMPLTINAGCLGIDEVFPLEKVITLYPNPTNSILNLKIYENSNLEIKNIIITNLIGQSVYDTNHFENKIDVTNFQKGVYIVKIITDKGNWNSKFIKE